MNKTRQQFLSRWLRQQRSHGQRWLHVCSLLGALAALVIVLQAWTLASLLQALIQQNVDRHDLLPLFIALFGCFVLRAAVNFLRERAGFMAGLAIRRALRQQVLNRLQQSGPAWIQGKPAGSWSSLLLEQIEDMQDYYARYLPQMTLALLIPLVILLTVLPMNWAAALILFATAPLIPLFMALVGLGAADANRRNFAALARLSGDFLDRLRGLDTLRLFHRGEAEKQHIGQATEHFRLRTMEVLRLAFLSSAVLEFFASLAIAIVAVYFGFSYLGELNFGHYNSGVTLFAGFLVLVLAPEFFQPLRDLGTFYHAKAQAVGAADVLEQFLSQDHPAPHQGINLPAATVLNIEACDLVICSPAGTPLAGPLTFSLPPGRRVAVVGQSGAGKTSLINALLGFLPYQGSLRIGGIELRELAHTQWHQCLSWVGQNPQLPATTLGENLLPAGAETERLPAVIAACGIDEFLPLLPQGLETEVGEHALRLSVGQAQRVAVARALMKPSALLLLDEPGASLDAHHHQRITEALINASYQQTTLMVTHRMSELAAWDEIWVMRDGKIIQQGSWDALHHLPGPLFSLLQQREETKR